jgi:hypothetical protein
VHNETLPVVAMCVGNEDRSPVGVHSCDTTPTPTGFAEIVGDDFPALPVALRIDNFKKELLRLFSPTLPQHGRR